MSLSKEQVLALQAELLELSSSPKAQPLASEPIESSGQMRRQAWEGEKVLEALEKQLAERHRMHPQELRRAFEEHKEDSDVYVNAKAIEASLAAVGSELEEAKVPPGAPFRVEIQVLEVVLKALEAVLGPVWPL